VASILHLVTRDDQGRVEDRAGWDEGAAAPEFPPGWDDYAAARRRFLERVAKGRKNPAEGESLEDGGDESWL